MWCHIGPFMKRMHCFSWCGTSGSAALSSRSGLTSKVAHAPSDSHAVAGVQAVAAYKLQQAAQQIQQLGWQQWQAALALNLCGALLPAATWLLEDAAARRVNCIADAQKLLSDAGNPVSLPFPLILYLDVQGCCSA